MSDVKNPNVSSHERQKSREEGKTIWEMEEELVGYCDSMYD